MCWHWCQLLLLYNHIEIRSNSTAPLLCPAKSQYKDFGVKKKEIPAALFTLTVAKKQNIFYAFLCDRVVVKPPTDMVD